MELPAPSPGLLDPAMRPVNHPAMHPAMHRATAGDRAARVRHRIYLMLMVMTLVVPGSAQLVAGDRGERCLATRLWAVLLLVWLVALVPATLHPQSVPWLRPHQT